MARAAREHLGLEKVLWMPTGPTHYRRPAAASGEQRLEMLRLALAEEPRAEIDARELRPGASGYTVDTLKELRLEHGPATLTLLMGADQYARLPSWHRPDEVRRLARIAVFERPGFPSGDSQARKIPFHPLSISASDIRARVARGEDIAALVPPPVANYIAAHGLYR